MFKSKNLSFATLQLAANPSVKQDFPDANVPAMLAAGWIPVPEAPSASVQLTPEEIAAKAALDAAAKKGVLSIEEMRLLRPIMQASLFTFVAPEGTKEDDRFDLVIKPIKGGLAFGVKTSRSGESKYAYVQGTAEINGTKHNIRVLLPQKGELESYNVGSIVPCKIVKGNTPGSDGLLVQVA